MQLLKSLVLSALTATAIASPIQQHHEHKREAAPEPVMEYVTVYNTFYVTAGHEANAVASSTPVAVTTSETPAPVAPTTTEAESTSTPAAVTTSPEWTAPASSSSSSSSSTSAPESTATSGGSGAGSAGARGIIYSPYSNEGGCKSSDQVARDLEKIKGYDIIRLYGTDCNQIQNVLAHKGANQQLFLGVFDVHNIDSQLDAMHSALNGDWSSVNTVSIGNELVNNGQATVSDIAGYLSTARSKLAQLQYTGPIVSVDTFIATINNPGLCELSDYMAVNAHAYFDGGVTSSQAGEWAQQQIERVWGACGGKKQVTIVESGWPSQGPTNGKAVCSSEDQSKAIDSLKASIGNDVFLFTAYNDLWKTPGVEQWWGIYGNSN